MKKIDLCALSSSYAVRRLDKGDIPLIYDLCKNNPQYYRYFGNPLTMELIEEDLVIAPPGIPLEQKYYIGFWDNDTLVAVMDLIDGYPAEDCAFIGFFMMNRSFQGRGIGSKIITEVLSYLKSIGFLRCRLGIDKGNPQSTHFWKKNGFSVIREINRENGTILLAERSIL